jgi:hypothetical protein
MDKTEHDHQRPLVRRAGWRAVSHLVRHHPIAALGAAAAGVKYAAREVGKDAAAGVRHLADRVRNPARKRARAKQLAEALDEDELNALAQLGEDRRRDKKQDRTPS